MNHTDKRRNLGAVFLVTALFCLLGPGLLYVMQAAGAELCSGARASQYPLRILLQWALLSLCPLGLFLFFRWKLKGSFCRAMGLELRRRFQKLTVGILVLVLVVMAGLAVRRTGDPVLVLLNLLYYVAVVAFAEEFLFRGICPYLLRDFSWQVVYLLPSLLFALIHVFAYNGFHALTGDAVLYFLTSQALGLMASGCCFQVLRERFGTLWVPVLLHAILDFSALLSL